jgi:hypothetical protein
VPPSSGQLISRRVCEKKEKCVSYIDQFEGVWQNTATEGGKTG